MTYANEVQTSFPSLSNYSVSIPGSCVTACLGVWNNDPHNWIYSLWSDTGTSEEELVSSGELDFSSYVGGPLQLSAEMVANIAFMLDVEYAGK